MSWIPVGLAPAYEGEDLRAVASHRWITNAPTFASLSQMLREVSPAVLVVSTRPDHIAPCAMAGLAAGCHLIVEKPLALDLPTLEALHAAARKAGRRVMAMLSMRGVPAFAAARQAVLGGRIGRPVLINTRKSYKWGQREEWFNERSKYGGTWPWIGIHNLDMAHFVTGLRPVKVMAAHSHAAHPNLPECEDVATAIFLLEGRVQMTASVDLCRPASAETWGDDWLRIVGTGGVIEANGSTGRVTILSAGAAVETIDAGIDPLPIYRDFLASLESADPAANAIAFQLTAAALVARDSADSGGPLPLDPGHWG